MQSRHTYFEWLYFYCVELLNTGLVHKLFTHEGSAFYSNLSHDWVMKQLHTDLPLLHLSAFIFLTVITKLYLFYTDGFFVFLMPYVYFSLLTCFSFFVICMLKCMLRMNVKAVATVFNFCKGLVTRGSGL